jgi:hypothetical protein
MFLCVSVLTRSFTLSFSRVFFRRRCCYSKKSVFRPLSLFSLFVRASLQRRCRCYGRANSYTPHPPRPPVLVVGTLLCLVLPRASCNSIQNVFGVAWFPPPPHPLLLIFFCWWRSTTSEVWVARLLFQWQNFPFKDFFFTPWKDSSFVSLWFFTVLYRREKIACGQKFITYSWTLFFKETYKSAMERLYLPLNR